jgi:oligopeptide/dipeptide ABC transporter ATP-binding protein
MPWWLMLVADAVVVENLRITLPSGGGLRTLVDGVSFRLRAGQVLGIVGESGSGKTLTSLAIGQLLPHPLRMEATRIELGGTELTTLPPGRLARVLGTGLAMIFQDPMSSMNPASRAGSQLTDGARRHRGLSREKAQAEAVQRLGEVRIGDARRALRRYPHQFSGGMQQRIMIAMGLMARPRVLIADEPTTALDVTVQAQVLEVLRDINASEGTAIILISHNLGVINQLCDRVLVMYAGRVVEEGDRERLLADPQHPYTKALLASVPVLSGTAQASELSTIPIRPPPPDEDLPGCAFAARCALAISRCTAEACADRRRGGRPGGLLRGHRRDHGGGGPVSLLGSPRGGQVRRRAARGDRGRRRQPGRRGLATRSARGRVRPASPRWPGPSSTAHRVRPDHAGRPT